MAQCCLQGSKRCWGRNSYQSSTQEFLWHSTMAFLLLFTRQTALFFTMNIRQHKCVLMQRSGINSEDECAEAVIFCKDYLFMQLSEEGKLRELLLVTNGRIGTTLIGTEEGQMGIGKHLFTIRMVRS